MRTGRLHQIAGQAGSGKTQISLRTALYSMSCVYIDTEGGLNLEQVQDLCLETLPSQLMTQGINDALNKIRYVRVTHDTHFLRLLENFDQVIPKETSLVVIDNITTHLM